MLDYLFLSGSGLYFYPIELSLSCLVRVVTLEFQLSDRSFHAPMLRATVGIGSLSLALSSAARFYCAYFVLVLNLIKCIPRIYRHHHVGLSSPL